MLEGVRRRRCPRGDPELGENVLQMACHGVLADDQRRRDVAVRPSGRHQPEHLDLTCGEALVGAIPPEQRSDAGPVGLGAEPVEGFPGGVQLEPGSVVVTDVSARQADQDPGPGRLVRHTEPMPGLHPVSQGDQRLARRVAGDQQRTLGACGHPRDGAAHRGRDRFEFLCRGPCAVQLADRQGDLHVGRKQSDAAQRLRRLPGGTPDRGGCGVSVTLREAEQGEAGLGFMSECVRLAEGSLGRGEIACNTMQLPSHVGGLAANQLVELAAVCVAAARSLSSWAVVQEPLR